MSSIPFDPSLVLGNLVDVARIDRLKKLAALQQPQILAEQKLNQLTLASYKMKMIANEMKSMQMAAATQERLANEVAKIKAQMGEAAIALAICTIDCATAVNEFMLSESQTQIDDEIESPLDYALSPVENYPLSSDTMDFDVQYFRNEGNEDGNSAHVDQVTDFIAGKENAGAEQSDSGQPSMIDMINSRAATKSELSAAGGDGDSEQLSKARKLKGGAQSAALVSNVQNTMISQTTSHKIEGTIVIVANCTHRSADIITPVFLDPKKALDAWNYSFPDDPLDTDPESMFAAAMPKYKDKKDSIKRRKEENAMHLLSGCTRGSSFVGMVHILKVEGSKSSQESGSVASAMKEMIDQDLALQQMSGNFGVGSSLSESVSSMVSSSMIQNHCSLVTKGIIPNIAASEMSSVIQTLRPDAKAIMGNIEAISKSGEKAASELKDPTAEAAGVQAKKGAQFMQLNSDFAKNTVQTVGSMANKNNKVIDTNSMMTAFTDYINKASAGGCGIPIKFFLKRIPKREVACCYINKFYPNGAATQKSARMGQLGAAPV